MTLWLCCEKQRTHGPSCQQMAPERSERVRGLYHELAIPPSDEVLEAFGTLDFAPFVRAQREARPAYPPSTREWRG